MRILGLELGSWSVKAVEMESRFRRLEVLDMHELRLPLEAADPIAEYKKTIENLMSRLPVVPEKIVTSLPPSQTSLRFMDLPIKQRRKVEQTYRFELEDSLPFGLDSAIVEHAVTKSPKGNLVMAGIAPKQHIQTHLDWLAQIGLDPDWLTFEGMGLLNFFLVKPDSAKNEPAEVPPITLLVDIGHLKTNLSILDNGRVEFFRSISVGGSAVTASIAANLNLSLEDAEQKKISDLNLDISSEDTGSMNLELVKAATQGFNGLLTDIQHSLVTFKSHSQKQITQVVYCGGSSKVKGFQKYFSDHLRISAKPLTEVDHMPLGKGFEPEKAIIFGESVGRAIVFARKAPFLFNFRKQELAKKNSLTEAGSAFKDPNTVRLLRYGAVLVAILIVHVGFATPIAKRTAIQAEKEVKKAFTITFRNQPASVAKVAAKSPETLQKFIDRQLRDIKDRQNLVANKRTPILKLIKSITEAFPSTVKVDVNSINLDDRAMVLEGVLYSGALNPVTQALNELEHIENVKLSMSSDGKRFTFTGEVDREMN